MPGRVEVPSYVKELHPVAWHLSPGPLAHCARCELGDFELLPIAVPLIEGLKQLVRAMEIVDPPQAYDRVAIVCLYRRRRKAAESQRD